MPENQPVFLITCEHAFNHVPVGYWGLFRGAEAVLESHRGYDPGALELALLFARRLGAPLHAGLTTRLLVELNRSEHHRALWSDYSRILPTLDQETILNRWYRPFRQAVRDWITNQTRLGNSVVHVSVHTFTPVWEGEMRPLEIGLLYDPSRPEEKAFCREWKNQMVALNPAWRVRMNQPYRGTSDGHTTALRRRFPGASYLGIELEVNQSLVDKSQLEWQESCQGLVESLVKVFPG